MGPAFRCSQRAENGFGPSVPEMDRRTSALRTGHSHMERLGASSHIGGPNSAPEYLPDQRG